MRKFVFSLMCAFMLLAVAAPRPVLAKSALVTYCNDKVKADETAQIIARASVVIASVKMILTTLFVAEQMAIVNSKVVDDMKGQISQYRTVVEILVPITKNLFKTLVPALDGLSSAINPRKGRMRKLKFHLQKALTKAAQSDIFMGNLAAGAKGQMDQGIGNFTPFYYYSMKVFKVWDYSAPVILSLTALNSSMCAIAKLSDGYCRKNKWYKSKCSLPVYNDLPSGEGLMTPVTGSCQNTPADQLVKRYIDNAQKYGATLAKLSKFYQAILPPLRKLDSSLKKLKLVITPLNPLANSFKASMSVLKQGLSPMKMAINGIEKVMNKKICVKFKIKVGKVNKQTKKCMKAKTIPKKIKQMVASLQKTFMKAVEKLINPLINKLVKKIPLPGVDKLEKVAKKLGDSFQSLGGISSVKDKITKYNPAELITQLKSIITDLKQINQQLKTAQ